MQMRLLRAACCCCCCCFVLPQLWPHNARQRCGTITTKYEKNCNICWLQWCARYCYCCCCHVCICCCFKIGIAVLCVVLACLAVVAIIVIYIINALCCMFLLLLLVFDCRYLLSRIIGIRLMQFSLENSGRVDTFVLFFQIEEIFVFQIKLKQKNITSNKKIKRKMQQIKRTLKNFK